MVIWALKIYPKSISSKFLQWIVRKQPKDSGTRTWYSQLVKPQPHRPTHTVTAISHWQEGKRFPRIACKRLLEVDLKNRAAVVCMTDRVVCKHLQSFYQSVTTWNWGFQANVSCSWSQFTRFPYNSESTWRVPADKLPSSMQSTGDQGNLLAPKEVHRRFLVPHPLCDQFHLASASSLLQRASQPPIMGAGGRQLVSL